MDWFFMYSLIRDISEVRLVMYVPENTLQGIFALHHSQFGAHGFLSSTTCLIDDRWQVCLGSKILKNADSSGENHVLRS